MSERIAYSEDGRRCGESHPRSTISDEVVEKIRDMHEYEGMSYPKIAKKTKLPVCTIAKLCRYERRATTVVRWKRTL